MRYIILTLILQLVAINSYANTQFNLVKPTIYKASELSNVSPVTLTTFIGLESTFNPKAKSKHSSATGLFQFTKRTWRVTVKNKGKQYNIKKWDVANPLHNAIMGAEYIKENKAILSKRLNRKVTTLDIYLAHLLAPRRVIALDHINQNRKIAMIYPKLAKYNKALFYNADGSSRTVKQFKDNIQNKITRAYNTFGVIIANELKVKKAFSTIISKIQVKWVCDKHELVRVLGGDINKYNPLVLTKQPLNHNPIKLDSGGIPQPTKEVNRELHIYDRRLIV